MHPVPMHHRRRTIAAIAVALAALCMLAPATARAADAPRFLLAAAPGGAIVHSRPGGPVVAQVAGTTPLGSPTWLWVVRTSRGGRWGRVVLPLRPNGRTGWIDLRGLHTVRTTTWVRAALLARRIWLMRGARPVASYSAAIGAASTSTPIGRFSITDRVLTGDPSGPFGWYAFGLSGHQPNLPPQWAGGDQLAIHGTNDPASIGTPASHGCLRVSASALTRLRSVLELGMPVVIMPTAGQAMQVARGSSLPRPGAGRHAHALHLHLAAAPAPPTVELRPLDSRRLLGRTLAEAVLVAPTAATAVVTRRYQGPAHRAAARTYATPVYAPLRLAMPAPAAVATVASHGRSPPG